MRGARNEKGTEPESRRPQHRAAREAPAFAQVLLSSFGVGMLACRARPADPGCASLVTEKPGRAGARSLIPRTNAGGSPMNKLVWTWVIAAMVAAGAVAQEPQSRMPPADTAGAFR